MESVDEQATETGESLSGEATGQPGGEGASNKRLLYEAKEDPGVETLPNLGLETTVDSRVRTHGAASISDETYWSGHILGLVLAIVGIVVIFIAKGPRKRVALHQLYEQKLAQSKGAAQPNPDKKTPMPSSGEA